MKGTDWTNKTKLLRPNYVKLTNAFTFNRDLKRNDDGGNIKIHSQLCGSYLMGIILQQRTTEECVPRAESSFS